MKRLILSAWVLLCFGGWYLFSLYNISLRDVPELLVLKLETFGIWKAAALYVLLFFIRPILLFPASVLTIVSSILFGPILSAFLTIIGENISANIVFSVSRFLGRDWIESHETSLLKKWDSHLSTNGLVTVLVMRLLFLPFDAVNIASALTGVRQRDFAVSTFIGILPGLLFLVLLGGSLSFKVSGTVEVFGVLISLKLILLLLSLSILSFSIALASIIKKRYQ